MSKNQIRKLGYLTAALLLVLIFSSPTSIQAQEEAPEIILLEADGPVVPALASYISRGIEEADARNAEAVIIMLDTPGGNVVVTLEIVQTILNSDVPVIVYVGPRGAKAASAGLLITLAGHAAVMAPETAIGASSPVGLQGEDLQGTSGEKVEQIVSAEARSLAERRGEEAVEVAGDAVFEAKAVSASEAVDAGLVDFMADDIDDLLNKLDGFQVEVNNRLRTVRTRDAQVIPMPMSALEEIMLLITHPNIVALLLSIGPLALIIEIRSPGGWVLGTIGVICIGLGLYGVGVLPVNWLGLIFVVLAIVLFVIEIGATTHGILTAAGATSLAAGLIILLNDPRVAPFGSLSIPLVIGQSLVIAAIFFFFAVMALRAQSRQPTTGREGLIGGTAVVTQDLDPQGTVLFLGERWKAETIEGTPLPVGSEVKIVKSSGLKLYVRPIHQNERSQPEVSSN